MEDETTKWCDYLITYLVIIPSSPLQSSHQGMICTVIGQQSPQLDNTIITDTDMGEAFNSIQQANNSCCCLPLQYI